MSGQVYEVPLPLWGASIPNFLPNDELYPTYWTGTFKGDGNTSEYHVVVESWMKFREEVIDALPLREIVLPSDEPPPSPDTLESVGVWLRYQDMLIKMLGESPRRAALTSDLVHGYYELQALFGMRMPIIMAAHPKVWATYIRELPVVYGAPVQFMGESICTTSWLPEDEAYLVAGGFSHRVDRKHPHQWRVVWGIESDKHLIRFKVVE